MSKMKSKKTKLIYGALILLLVVLLLTSTFLLISLWEKGNGLFPAHEEEFNSSITVDGVDYVYNDDIQSILVLGLDKFENTIDNTGYYNDQQADFLMLFVIDNKNETYSAIHLNRDTMTDINVLGVAGEKLDVVNHQLALAHTYGNGKEVSCRNTVDAVSGLLNNIKIDRYVSITMDAVPVITDLVGGVEVEVKDDFTNVDSSLIMGETVVLTGENALNFVRSRQGLEDSSNLARMDRQQEYISSLFDAVIAKSKQDDKFLANAFLELSDYLVSNFTAVQLENLINNISEYESSDIYEIDGKAVAGDKFMEFYADKDSVDKIVLDLFYTKSE